MKSVKGRIRKIPSESMIRLWRNFFVMADDLVRRLEEALLYPPFSKSLDMEGKKKSEPISDLENPVRIILVWCGRWDWILAARRRSVSAVLKPHRGLIHCGFFKSVSRFTKKEAQHFCRAFFFGAGNRTGFSRLDAARSAPFSSPTGA